MKKITLIVSIIILTSCMSQKNTLKKKMPKSLVQLKLAADTLTARTQYCK
jgi:uncharacterized lipoprotein YajG